MKIWIVAAALMLSAPTSAQHPAGSAASPIETPISTNEFLELKTYRLWSSSAPGSSRGNPDETPTVTVFTPQRGFSVRTAVVVAPGGGYTGLAGSLEGRQVGDWFAARGVTAFVLKYRVRPVAGLPVVLQDGTRAMRFVRTNARLFEIDPTRIGMIGFSAGGHLSAMTAELADAGEANSSDPVERVSSRPDFLVLGYPWLEATKIDSASGTSQYCSFGRVKCDPALYTRFMPVDSVNDTMPPTFIYHTVDDNLVPVEGSWRFFKALREKKVDVEMHLFESGPHGTGLGGSDQTTTLWPVLLENWLRSKGFIGSNKPR